MLRLFLLAPTTVFAAEVASNPVDSAYPVDQLTFDNVSTGAFGDIAVGQTIFLGSSAGKSDHGTQRIRKAATSDTIYIGRTSKGYGYGEIGPTGTSHITVVDLRQIWTKPYFEDVDISTSPPTRIHFKDGDIAYSDQTSEPPPVSNCGVGTMATINGSNVIVVEFDGTASFAVADGASISTYAWDIDDGTLEGGYALSDSVIQANFPAGFRWVSLTVTDDNDKTHVSYCPVFARNPASDDTIPIDGLSIRVTQEGQEATVQLSRSLPEATYPDNTLVMIADGEPSSAGDRSHLEFIGWHHQDSADHSAERTGYVTGASLTCLDVAGKMQAVHGFSQEISHAASPSHWGEMATANMDKVMHYLLQWHSNVLDLADWTWSGTGATYALNRRGANPGTLWDQVKAQADEMNPTYKLTCNRLGQLAVIVDPQHQSGLTRTSVVQTTIDESEWSNVRYDHERYPRYFWLWGGAAIAANSLNADGEIDTVFCVAPGTAPGIGYTEMRDEVGLTPSQAILNTTTGHRYARMNAPERPFRITLTGGNDHGIEPANMTWVQLTLAEDMPSAPRGLSLSAARGLPLELTLRWNVTRTGVVKSAELLWEREITGADAVTVIPEENTNEVETGLPDNYHDDNAGDIVLVQPIPGPEMGFYAGQQQIALFGIGDVGTFQFLTTTKDFQAPESLGGPTWTLESIQSGEVLFSFVVDPFSPGYLGTGSAINGWVVGESKIMRVTDFFGTPGIATQHTFANAVSGNGHYWRTINASFGAFFESGNPWLVVVSHYKDTGGHTGTWAIYSQDAGATWSSEVQISEHYATGTIADKGRPIGLYLSPKTPGLAYTAAYTATGATPSADGYVSTDWGASWSAMSNPDIQPGHHAGGSIHVPWPTNDSEKIVYHGHVDLSTNRQFRLKRIAEDGTTITDISPADAGISYGVDTYGFGVRTYDLDRAYAVLAGVGNDTSGNVTDDDMAVFVSSNNGDTWTKILGPFDASFFGGLHAAFAGDNPNVIFMWGGPKSLGDGIVNYTENFGATEENKAGNILTDAAWDGYTTTIGLAGGPPEETSEELLPAWGLYDPDVGLTDIQISGSIEILLSNSATNQFIQKDLYVLFAPPADAVRARLNCQYTMLRERTNSQSSVSMDVDPQDPVFLMSMDTNIVVSQPAYDVEKVELFYVEWELNTAETWPKSRDNLINDEFTDETNYTLILLEVDCNSIDPESTGSGLVTLIADVVEIELASGEIYNPSA